MNLDYINIGKFAANERKKRGWTQAQAARRISTFRRAISDIETGKTRGQIDVFLRYLAELNICLTPGIKSEPNFEDLHDIFEEDI